MANEQPETLDQLRTEFRRFPAPVVEEFDKARAKMPRTMEEGSILLWGQSGLGNCRPDGPLVGGRVPVLQGQP